LVRGFWFFSYDVMHKRSLIMDSRNNEQPHSDQPYSNSRSQPRGRTREGQLRYLNSNESRMIWGVTGVIRGGSGEFLFVASLGSRRRALD
jgi:hypothetical protein